MTQRERMLFTGSVTASPAVRVMALMLTVAGIGACVDDADRSTPAAAPQRTAVDAPVRTRGAAAGFELMEATVSDIQEAIRAGTLTSEGLVRQYLARVQAYNGTCVSEPEGILGRISTVPDAGQINALATLNLRPAAREAFGFDARKARSMTDPLDDEPGMPDALEIAASQDAYFAETGELVGPLHGVVMAIKDQYDTFDMRSTSGADAHYDNDRPPADADFVVRLREAGAIILAKSNLGEYASGVPRSSFGGTFCNPYDTERSPLGSSSGSGTAVAANLVTCAIAEETGSSIRNPARANSTVGIAPTQELVSRHGMIQAGINTRTGPICRTVEDVARVLTVIAGYDPKDELTVFSVGRTPTEPYESFTAERSLEGITIGVVREYMDKSLFSEMDAETIDIVSRAAEDLAGLGASVVDPGSGGALFTQCLRTYNPHLQNRIFARQFPDLFPRDDAGAPASDHVATLIAMAADPSRVPETLTLRDLGQAQAVGEGRYMMDRYLLQRGDTAIASNADLIEKADFHDDPQFPDRREARERAQAAQELDMAERMLQRFAVQQMTLQCMAEMGLDALVYPTGNLPPAKLGAPPEPSLNGRGNSWSMFGRHGFPALSVPAGFTTHVYDRVRDPGAPVIQPTGGGGATAEGTSVVGPIPARLPVGMDIVARPFDEPMLFRIAAAYEAATGHREPPPGFDALSSGP